MWGIEMYFSVLIWNFEEMEVFFLTSDSVCVTDLIETPTLSQSSMTAEQKTWIQVSFG